MAIPKKGTRKITVDGKVYRWCVKVDYDYNEKFFIIESIDDDRYQISGGFQYKVDFVISPKIIEQAIKQAQLQGWKPEISNIKKVIIDTQQIAINLN